MGPERWLANHKVDPEAIFVCSFRGLQSLHLPDLARYIGRQAIAMPVAGIDTKNHSKIMKISCLFHCDCYGSASKLLPWWSIFTPKFLYTQFRRLVLDPE